MLKPRDPAWDGGIQIGFKDMPAAHPERRRLASQSETHLSISGHKSDSDHSRPAIEFF